MDIVLLFTNSVETMIFKEVCIIIDQTVFKVFCKPEKVKDPWPVSKGTPGKRSAALI